jgi:CheY-like chemotaxis protein
MPRMRVLAAEDNKTNQLVLRKVIKALDLELEIVPNGREAVRLFEEFHPHLIFMDISMPEMDGKEATGEIRRLEAEAGGHVPIVALTAHAIDEDGQSALDAGLDHYLTKPLRKTAILERIRDAVPKDVADPFADVES